MKKHEYSKLKEIDKIPILQKIDLLSYKKLLDKLQVPRCTIASFI